MTKGGRIQALANTVNDLDREMVKLRTQLEMKQSSLLDEQKRIHTAEKNVVEVSKSEICVFQVAHVLRIAGRSRPLRETRGI